MENGDRLIKAEPCAHVLPLNHYTRALEKPENEAKRRCSRSARSRVRITVKEKFLSAFFVSNLAIMMIFIMMPILVLVGNSFM